MFGAILTSMWSMIQSFGSNLSNAFKCKSYCCNKVVINNSTRCNAFGDIYNRWTRELTPSVETPSRREGIKSKPSFGEIPKRKTNQNISHKKNIKDYYFCLGKKTKKNFLKSLNLAFF
jgi:hypothetical protein